MAISPSKSNTRTLLREKDNGDTQPLRSAPSSRGEILYNIHRRAIPLTFIIGRKLLSCQHRLSGCIFYWSSVNTEAARNVVLTIVGVVSGWNDGSFAIDQIAQRMLRTFLIKLAFIKCYFNCLGTKSY
ncbi:hypothetical protein CEXT_752471 [Caerostris extrusa]|uniref:Uncharacterized protein n=1 Tax=Caerostris extrusa TaxID=172846 RepID=A0AAV4X2H2_CAEEX|nr:hypothetical protein CEXT_752471 [Caerostris extrusa]